MMKITVLLWTGLLILNMPMIASAGSKQQTQPISHNKSIVHASKKTTSTRVNQTDLRQRNDRRKPPEIMLKNSTEKLSYAFGMQVADSLKQGHMKIDVNRFILGFKDGLEGRKALLSPKKAKKFRDRFYEKKRQLLAENNLAAARKCLAENRHKKGVATTSSGLQYMVLRKGYGAHPESSAMVRVQYSGRLVDGTEFYSTYKKGRSVVLPVDRVIQGLGEVFELMTVGSRYRFFIPPKLAYGEKGSVRKSNPMLR